MLIVLSAILCNKKRNLDEDRDITNVSDLVSAYRERDTRRRGENITREYSELSDGIAEPPPDYQTANCDRSGFGALGPDIATPSSSVIEAPPNYRRALRTKEYNPSTIGPNPPPYTNELPEVFFPEDNKAYEKEKDEPGTETETDETPSTNTYIPRIQQPSLVDRAIVPFKSLLRRSRISRSARNRDVIARVIEPHQVRPSSYDQPSTSSGQNNFTDIYPQSGTFPRSRGTEALNTIGEANTNPLLSEILDMEETPFNSNNSRRTTVVERDQSLLEGNVSIQDEEQYSHRGDQNSTIGIPGQIQTRSDQF